MVLRNARLRDGRLVDIGIDAGRVSRIASAESSSLPSPAGTDAVDVAGMLVLPALVNGHAHLDKTFVGAPWQPHLAGSSIRERIRSEKELRRRLAEGEYDRSTLLAHRMVEFGTGLVRVHVDVDDEIGLRGVEEMLRLREEFRDELDLQIIAFPQSGVLSQDHVAELLDEAILLGADGIGGLDPALIDGDIDGHFSVVFDIARRRDVPLDVHLHSVGPIAVDEYESLGRHVRAGGLEGRVVVSHAFGLGALTDERATSIFDMLAQSGIAVMTNGPAGPMPPVQRLREAGVLVFAGTDNVRDAWWPFGDGDVLRTAGVIAYQQDLQTDVELGIALDLVTDCAARALGRSDYGIMVGHAADLVVVGASAAAEAVVAAPVERHVMHAGCWIAHTTRKTETGVWPEAAPMPSDVPAADIM